MTEKSLNILTTALAWAILAGDCCAADYESERTVRKMSKKIKCNLYHDNFQNYKRYNIPKGAVGNSRYTI